MFLHRENKVAIVFVGARELRTNMKTTIVLLEVFIVAILTAFAITFTTGTSEIRLLALGFVVPIASLGIIFIHYCRKMIRGSYAGSAILVVVGILLRVAVSSQPNLEVCGGLPIGVTTLYIALGALLSLKSYESFLELRSFDKSA